MTVTMGFTLNGTDGAWEVDDLVWFKDERMDAGIGLWRRQRPRKDAKLELRNSFVNMRDRRAPYDGELIRDTAETSSMTRILEVPGKSAGTISGDLLYGLTLRMVGHPTILDADRALQSTIESTWIIEHGFGDEISGATTVNARQENSAESSWQKKDRSQSKATR
jgi:hypothetical protein